MTRSKSPPRISVLDLPSKRRTTSLDHPGRWISFNATRPGRSRIFVAPVRNDGMIPEPESIAITDGPWDDKPRWLPDGSVLYFVSERHGFRCVLTQRLDARKHPAGTPISIFHAHDARRSLANVGIGDFGFFVARDKLVFNISERTGNLWGASLDSGP